MAKTRKADGLRWYRYSRIPGNSHGGVYPRIDTVFQAKSDKDAKEQAEKMDAHLLGVGGFVINPILERGRMVRVAGEMRAFKKTSVAYVPSEFSHSATARE